MSPPDPNPQLSAGNAQGYVKSRAGAPPDYYRLEAAGLRWLASAGSVAVPPVLAVGDDRLVLVRVEPRSPGPSDASRFGVELARMHRAGAPAYGSPPPNSADPPKDSGFIADLELPFGAWHTFGPFYAEARILPYLRLLGDRFSGAERATFTTLLAALQADDESVIGPPESPARLHGDLWSGNVVWGSDDEGAIRGWLIDPAAHGGHRETDLAMLALFGAPHLGAIVEAYDREHPLAPGWQDRISLHQVHPLLVHAVLFGGGYLNQAITAARRAQGG